MNELIIGMDGFIGSNLCRHLPDAIKTTRRNQQMDAAHFFDLTKRGISSTTAEWLIEHYGRQKRIAECYLRALPHVGIVRAGRVLKSNVDDLCHVMIEMGRNRQRGVRLWNEDEKPYQH